MDVHNQRNYPSKSNCDIKQLVFFADNSANIILNLQVTVFLIYLSFIFQLSAMIRNDFFPRLNFIFLLNSLRCRIQDNA